MTFQDNLFVIFCFKHFFNLLNEIKPWIFMEEIGEDRQGENLNKYKSQMFRQEICPLARNSIIANSLKQCTFFFHSRTGNTDFSSSLKKHLIAHMSLLSFFYLKVNRITTG